MHQADDGWIFPDAFFKIPFLQDVFRGIILVALSGDEKVDPQSTAFIQPHHHGGVTFATIVEFTGVYVGLVKGSGPLTAPFLTTSDPFQT